MLKNIQFSSQKFNKHASLNSLFGLDKIKDKLPKYLKIAIKEQKYDLIAAIFSDQFLYFTHKIKYDFKSIRKALEKHLRIYLKRIFFQV